MSMLRSAISRTASGWTRVASVPALATSTRSPANSRRSPSPDPVSAGPYAPSGLRALTKALMTSSTSSKRLDRPPLLPPCLPKFPGRPSLPRLRPPGGRVCSLKFGVCPLALPCGPPPCDVALCSAEPPQQSAHTLEEWARSPNQWALAENQWAGWESQRALPEKRWGGRAYGWGRWADRWGDTPAERAIPRDQRADAENQRAGAKNGWAKAEEFVVLEPDRASGARTSSRLRMLMRPLPPGHECPGYASTEKPGEPGSWRSGSDFGAGFSRLFVSVVARALMPGRVSARNLTK